MPHDADVYQLRGVRDLVLVREPLPAPKPGQVLARTFVSVVSPGTELAAYDGLPPIRGVTRYPRLQGYCNVARVERVGEGVDIAVGARVLTHQSHRSAFVCDASEVILTVPSNLATEDAAPLYLYQLGARAIIDSALQVGEPLVVVGLGTLGLACVEVARARGHVVHGVSESAALRARATSWGANASGRADCPRASGAVVVSTTSSWTDWQLCLDAARHDGAIHVLGFPGRGEPAPAVSPLRSDAFYAKNLRVVSSGLPGDYARYFTRIREEVAELSEEARAGKIRPREVVGEWLPFDALEKAYTAIFMRTRPTSTMGLRWNA